MASYWWGVLTGLVLMFMFWMATDMGLFWGSVPELPEDEEEETPPS